MHRAPCRPALRPLALIADHEEGVRHFIRFVLARQGYDVLEASNGIEALQASEQHPGMIDVLVADLHMPGMDGRQLPDLIARQQPDLRTVYTDFLEDYYAWPGSRAVCLAKPFNEQQLLEAVCTARPSPPAIAAPVDESRSTSSTERTRSTFILPIEACENRDAVPSNHEDARLLFQEG